MGAKTGIEWADATVDVWEGCTKISPACKRCYAETNSPVRAMEVRIGEALQVEPSADGKRRLKMWGPHGFRYETANWEGQLRALNRKAQRIGKRLRVFINSLSDIFEDWQGAVYALEDGKPVTPGYSLRSVRERFFRVAEECTELDILLLTKRPENVLRMVPPCWIASRIAAEYDASLGWPSHIWIGTTAEDQEHADKRIPELLKVPAKVRFLSMEPLLGKVDLPWLHNRTIVPGQGTTLADQVCSTQKIPALQWVIVGGESGHSNGVRPMHPDWVRSIRDQCQAAGVPFFFKQWGEWADAVGGRGKYLWVDSAGKTSDDVWDFDEDGDQVLRQRVGKKNAGRVLDGRTWDEVPR